MITLLAAVFLLQAPLPGEKEEPSLDIRYGLEGGVAWLRLDPAIGAEDGLVPGVEGAFTASLRQPKYTIGLRAYYRRFDVTFEEFNGANADLDGEVQQLGLNLVVTYPFLGPLTIGVELGGGGLMMEHDLEEETSSFFEGGGFLRLDLFAGLYLHASGLAQFAMTNFGGQETDSDHLSWTGRVGLGFEIAF